MPLLLTSKGEVAFRFEDETVTIGREDYNAFPLKERGVSRLHAKIERTAEGYTISDMGSTNGTFVNGERIERRLLRDGDVIRIGRARLTFHLDSPETEQAALPTAEREPEEEEFEEEEFEEVEPEDEDIPTEVEPEEETDEFIIFRFDLEQAERRRRVRAKVALVVWLFISFVLHFWAFYIVRNVSFGLPAPIPRRTIKIDMDLVALTLRRKPPEVVIEHGPVKPEEQQTARRELKKLEKEVRPVPVETVSLAKIASLLPIGEPTMPEWKPVVPEENVYRIVVPEKPKRFQDVMDDFALEIMHALEKGRLLVVLIFDESLSLKPDRHYMYERLDRVVELLNLHLTPVELARLRWAVVSFGRYPRIWQNATDDIGLVRSAILKVPEDKTGIENLVAAIRYSMKCLDPRFGQTFFAVVTDETGDDTKDDALVEDTIKLLIKRKVRVFFFGREANFSYPLVPRQYRDPSTGTMMTVYVNGGPESAEPEFFTPDELFNRVSVLPSGFGMYVQSRISAATKGKFYLLTGKPSPYDEDKLPQYAPELCSRQEYASLRQRSELRRTLWQIIQGWDALRPEGRGRNTSNAKRTIQDGMAEARKALNFCDDSLRMLRKLRDKVEREKSHPMRWRAHYDLIYAELLKFRYLLLEYIAALSRLHANVQPLLNGAPFIGFIVRPASDRAGTTKEAEEAYGSALRAFRAVIANHEGTPWAEMARLQMNQMGSFRALPIYRIQRTPGDGSGGRRRRQPPPKPPAL